ncbi:hypothetical protein [Bosea sp. (in: a-proteobacteria)]|uniref:hypothetical protein n=1 Tax=Bosea sp. (in: a-proteobacteria) TaxID=1871050 RepID=UPI00273746CF|nr:hypothetical protein [Bosea sp. (in: a-proteobacteria)]MDP3407265.1 hypothetical protein [Bosea sp. (in: a-proteobacteria)]
MRHERPIPGTICQAEDLNTVLLEKHGEALARNLAGKLLLHLGVVESDPMLLIRLGGERLEAPLSALIPSLSAAELARCLSEHPREAFQTLYVYLDLHWQSVRMRLDVNRADGAVAFPDDAAPHKFPDAVVRHGASPVADASLPGRATEVNLVVISPVVALQTALRGAYAVEARAKIEPDGLGQGIRDVVIADMVDVLDQGRIDRGYADIFDLYRAGYHAELAASLGPHAAKLLAARVAERGEDATVADGLEVA